MTKLYLLDKKVLSLRNQPQSFLQGLTANTLDKPWNAFVDVHGKIIATIDQLKINDEEFLIVVAGSFVTALLQHLDRYLRLSKTVVTQTDRRVYFDLENDYPCRAEEFSIPQKKGKLVLTSCDLSAAVDEKEFRWFRVKNGIPLHGVDYADDFLLNVSPDQFVSFSKGCFLGQEPISKVHNRSKPTWRLVAKYEDECHAEEQAKMTSKVSDPANGRKLGFVFEKNV